MPRPVATGLEPERSVLLACVRADVPEALAMLRQALPAVSDWHALQAAALQHGLVPLLHRRVLEAAPTAYPSEPFAALHELAIANERRNLRLSARLLGVLDLLARHEVTALTLKGPVLSQVLYGDPGLRHFSDLDIAVRPDELVTARDALLAEGFELVTGAGIAVDRLLVAEGELVLEAPSRDLLVELHWRVGPRFASASLPAEDLIRRAQPLRFMGRDILWLAPDDLFVAQCIHSASHSWNRLELISALGAWGAGAAPSQWRSGLARAAALGCLRRCIVGCLMARDVAGCRLPADVSDHVDRDAGAARLARRARQALLTDDLTPASEDGLRSVVWESLVLDKPSARAAHFVARVLTPGARDWESAAVPPRLPALYYLRRPTRLARRYLRRRDAD